MFDLCQYSRESVKFESHFLFDYKFFSRYRWDILEGTIQLVYFLFYFLKITIYLIPLLRIQSWLIAPNHGAV